MVFVTASQGNAPIPANKEPAVARRRVGISSARNILKMVVLSGQLPWLVQRDNVVPKGFAKHKPLPPNAPPRVQPPPNARFPRVDNAPNANKADAPSKQPLLNALLLVLKTRIVLLLCVGCRRLAWEGVVPNPSRLLRSKLGNLLLPKSLPLPMQGPKSPPSRISLLPTTSNLIRPRRFGMETMYVLPTFLSKTTRACRVGGLYSRTS